MIHAENGDMIEWLTGKSIAEGYRMFKTDSDTEKLESKGMVGKYTQYLLQFRFLFANLYQLLIITPCHVLRLLREKPPIERLP